MTPRGVTRWEALPPAEQERLLGLPADRFTAEARALRELDKEGGPEGCPLPVSIPRVAPPFFLVPFPTFLGPALLAPCPQAVPGNAGVVFLIEELVQIPDRPTFESIYRLKSRFGG